MSALQNFIVTNNLWCYLVMWKNLWLWDSSWSFLSFIISLVIFVFFINCYIKLKIPLLTYCFIEYKNNLNLFNQLDFSSALMLVIHKNSFSLQLAPTPLFFSLFASLNAHTMLMVLCLFAYTQAFVIELVL